MVGSPVPTQMPKEAPSTSGAGSAGRASLKEANHKLPSGQKGKTEEGPPRAKPNCARCNNHGISERLRGHKKHCRFRYCTCVLCCLTVKRQTVMARQTAVRREHIQETELAVELDKKLAQERSLSQLNNNMRPATPAQTASHSSASTSASTSPYSTKRKRPSAPDSPIPLPSLYIQRKLHPESDIPESMNRTRRTLEANPPNIYWPQVRIPDEGGFGGCPMSANIYNPIEPYVPQAYVRTTRESLTQIKALLPIPHSAMDSKEVHWKSIIALLETFHFRLDTSPLLHIILKYVSNNINEVCTKIIEAQNELRAARMWTTFGLDS